MFRSLKMRLLVALTLSLLVLAMGAAAAPTASGATGQPCDDAFMAEANTDDLSVNENDLITPY
jgi:hypothetical protein